MGNYLSLCLYGWGEGSDVEYDSYNGENDGRVVERKGT